MAKQRINKVSESLTLHLASLIEDHEIIYPTISAAFDSASALGWDFSVVHQTRGFCSYPLKQITIPAWAFEKGVDYLFYYLSHELAHIFAGYQANHGPEFMKEFKRICPTNLQHFELSYKPKLAAAAGITAKDF